MVRNQHTKRVPFFLARPCRTTLTGFFRRRCLRRKPVMYRPWPGGWRGYRRPTAGRLHGTGRRAHRWTTYACLRGRAASDAGRPVTRHLPASAFSAGDAEGSMAGHTRRPPKCVRLGRLQRQRRHDSDEFSVQEGLALKWLAA